MPLNLVRTIEEGIADATVVDVLRHALAACGRATLLVPSFSQALDAQRALAAAGGLSLGVTVTTPAAWAAERWEVWGDGRRLVDGVSRDVLCARVLSRAAGEQEATVRDNPGTAALLADLARAGTPWLTARSATPEAVSEAEASMVALVDAYAAQLDACGLVEECSVMVALPQALDDAGAQVDPLVLAGFGEMARAARELVCALAATHEVTFVARQDAGPASAEASRLADELVGLARERGARVVEGVARPELVVGSRTVDSVRAPELSAVLGRLFLPQGRLVEPTGALRLALPAGPSAEGELVAREVRALADAGAHDVVLVAPDSRAAWEALSARLSARGVSVRAQLSMSSGELEAGRAYLEFARTVAQLVQLAQSWPAPTAVTGGMRVSLGDMSWWPPRALSDFLLGDISHLDANRARRLDAEWRSNRLLTPTAVLERLQSEKDVSPEVALATRELLRGRLGSAASKLLAPYVRGNKTASPAAPQAIGALTAVLGVAKSLKELGLTADPQDPGAISLVELVAVADAALARAHVSLRLERTVEGATCAARLMDVASAERLAPGSADALVLLGQTSTESSVPTTDDVLSALLASYGVEPPSHAMDQARARFSTLVRVPRQTLVLERLLFGADGRLAYPSVMMTELLACYGVAADARPPELVDALGRENVTSRGEGLVRENASYAGVAPARRARETPAPAGRISAWERALVLPPPEGMPVGQGAPVLSASQIETYLECPYKWFSLRRLRLRDADARFTGAELGTFVHRVLEVTHRELLARAVERAEKDRLLADLRARTPDALQDEAYRAAAERLLARAQADPVIRLPGSSTAGAEALEEARQILSEEFDAHLSHQYQLAGGRRPLPQALVAHSAQEHAQVQGLRRDLSTLLDFEGRALRGYEPRFFEWGFGRGGAEVSYAGVRIVGTVDRIDVDAHGQAVVIDYKHKSDVDFAREYDVFGPDGAPAGALTLPRRVQSLIYGQVVRRAFPDLTVRAAVYLCTKGNHALAGAVDDNALDLVFGEKPPSPRRAPRVAVPRTASFGRTGEARGMQALLDACEEAIAERIERLLAGDIEARPLDAGACSYCPVLNCERRLRK